ncbi:MAG TPA: glutathione S-transferase family protein [Gammaproteobacteria bacterium]
MIELYSLHWSHYVEKVRWALDFKRLDYTVIPVSVPGKPEMAHLKCAGVESSGAGRVLTVPTILDTATGECVTESSAILEYLDRKYSDLPLLAPREQEQETWQWVSYLDGALGLPARRLGYTQLILEVPELLVELFMKDAGKGFFMRPVIRRVAAVALSGLLIQRFRLLHLRDDKVLESAFAALRQVAARLKDREYLAGGVFSAADITLASLLRPLRVVPIVREHPEFEALFSWQENLFGTHGRPELLYETRIREQREKRGWSVGCVRWFRDIGGDVKIGDPGAVDSRSPRNDQQSISRARSRSPGWIICGCAISADMRANFKVRESPDSAALHPGYTFGGQCVARKLSSALRKASRKSASSSEE